MMDTLRKITSGLLEIISTRSDFGHVSYDVMTAKYDVTRVLFDVSEMMSLPMTSYWSPLSQ